MPDRAAVLDALRPVHDPELDQSIVDLDFVAAVDVEGSAVRVHLRLPTYFCAPNFSYLMVDDVREALLGLPDVTEAVVVLDDHFTAEEITEGVNGELGFAATFPGLADGELGNLRLLFRRKALLARQHRASRAARAAGRTSEDLAVLPLKAIPAGEALEAYRTALADLGLPSDDAAPFLVDGAGRPVPAHRAEQHLAQARSLALSIELNAEFCSGVLATRYPDARPVRKEETV